MESPDLHAKYQKLATEYSKVVREAQRVLSELNINVVGERSKACIRCWPCSSLWCGVVVCHKNLLLYELLHSEIYLNSYNVDIALLESPRLAFVLWCVVGGLLLQGH